MPAVAVNSATSGLLVACLAAGVSPGDEVIVSPWTMSATAAAPTFLGAKIIFGDIDPETFCLKPSLDLLTAKTKAVIITNLFGHPGELAWWRRTADTHGFILIEDNAQAPFASEYARYAGTVGHIGVFSFNVHKHIHAGEGGIVVTADDALAEKLRLYRNHSELAGGVVGLNLRMTEYAAAIAIAQLKKRERIIKERIEIAEAMTDMVKGMPGLTPPVVREGCRHVYYVWALKVKYGDWESGRDLFVEHMNAEGVPLKKGYVEPLYHLPAFQRFKPEGGCPVAEKAHRTLALYENCAWSPTSEQLKQFKEAFLKTIDKMPKMG